MNAEVCRCTPPAPTCDPNKGNACTASNACGDSNPGTIQCDGSCSATAPANPAGYGNSCTASNACGDSNPGTIGCNGCSATAPALPAGYGNSCTSAANNCGDTNSGTIGCNGCDATKPADRVCTVCDVHKGDACTASNACGDSNPGTIQCDGSCSATAPALPAGYGNSCTSAANNCGDKNTGTIGCNGCDATKPADKQSCGTPPSCGPLASCTITGGGSTCCLYGCDGTDPSGCAAAPNPNPNPNACQPGSTQSCTSSANACGQTNAGIETCDASGNWSSCSAAAPADPSNLGNACTSGANNCGDKNSGTIQCGGSCSASTPANRANCSVCDANMGNACTSSANTCGDKNSGTIQCSGSCSASTPANPAGLGNACTSAANNCGDKNSGTIQCDGSCSATKPADRANCMVCDANTGNGCTSAPNACGDTSQGKIQCDGTCSANPPAGTCGLTGGFTTSLSASPVSGAAPLSVTLAASVQTNDVADTFNYSFFWDCQYAGSDLAGAIQACGALPTPISGQCVTNTVGAKCDAMTHASQAAQTTYQSVRTYHPKVIVEQAGNTATALAAVVVQPGTGIGGSGYNCVNQSCSAVTSGASYSTLASCQAACGSGITLPICTIGASPARITAGGSSKVSWACSNASQCTLNGSAVSPVSGSVTVSPSSDTTYVLSCKDPTKTKTVNAQATVSVIKNPGLKEVAP